jgi:hypothetical protein
LSVKHSVYSVLNNASNEYKFAIYMITYNLYGMINFYVISPKYLIAVKLNSIYSWLVKKIETRNEIFMITENNIHGSRVNQWNKILIEINVSIYQTTVFFCSVELFLISKFLSYKNALKFKVNF